MSQAFGGMYKVMLLLHLLSAVVAFAPAVIHPIFAARSKDADAGLRRTLFGWMAQNGRMIHSPALLLVGVFGLGMVFSSKPDGADENLFGFDQAWVSLSFLLWIVIGGLVTGMIMPNERRLASGEGDPQEAQRKVDLAGQITTVLLLVVFYLMIFKPGL